MYTRDLGRDRVREANVLYAAMVIECRTQLLQLTPRKDAGMQQSCCTNTCAGDWPKIGPYQYHCCLLLTN